MPDMTDHGRLAENEPKHGDPSIGLMQTVSDTFLATRDAELRQREDQTLGITPPVESEPKTLDVRSGTVIAAVHCCDHPDVLIGREEMITRPVVWRCDCGAYWYLRSERKWHTPMLSQARFIYERSWVRERDRLTLMWYALRRLFRK